MPWTREQKLDALLRLPWTIRTERDADGHYVARVAEIPSAVADGATEQELERDFWASLRASLEAHLDTGDPIPLPKSVSVLPWHAPRPSDSVQPVRATPIPGKGMPPAKPNAFTTSLSLGTIVFG